MTAALVIGAGPAGLMAAEEMARAGLSVTVVDAMAAPARKFLMAGKSGLNITKEEAEGTFRAVFWPRPAALDAALRAFGPAQVVDWAQGLGQPVFTGSSGRVFPVAMKASPLLRAWLQRLAGLGVTLRTRTAWAGWDGAGVLLDGPGGREVVTPAVTVLALGGASWARLGSTGAWAGHLAGQVAPFRPANMGLAVAWSAHMAPHLGQPVKGTAFRAGDQVSRGEWVVSSRGMEGGGVYAVSRAVRDGAALLLDLFPDLTADGLRARAARLPARDSQSNRRRKLGLAPVAVALAQEWARPLPADVAALKAIPVPHAGPRPLDEAISTAGGLRFDALEGFMLRDRPGTFAAGEMLDWEAPTGGYLITACLATGRAAGRQAAAWVRRDD